MEDYENAKIQATLSLSQNDILFDYNNLIQTDFALTKSTQFPLSETLYLTTLSNTFNPITEAIVDSSLYQSYDSNDLRKIYFFQIYSGNIRFRGSYAFKTLLRLFDAVANDEVYLIKAECEARLGDFNGAMNDLNNLLIKRYKAGTFVPRSAVNSDDALVQILTERKKELIYRGTRWTDLRRLNKDAKFAITLKRVFNGVTYTLPPNDPRYVFAIPDPVIQLSGILQNQR